MNKRERLRMLRVLRNAELLIDSLTETAEVLSPFAKRTRKTIRAAIKYLEADA